MEKNGYYTLNQTRKKRLNPKQKPNHPQTCAELKKPAPRKEKIVNKDSSGVSADELAETVTTSQEPKPDADDKTRYSAKFAGRRWVKIASPLPSNLKIFNTAARRISGNGVSPARFLPFFMSWNPWEN